VARSAGLPRRVVTILEGESLLNDATALVSLRTAVAALGAAVTFWEVGQDFLLAVIVGPLAGFVVAKLSIWLFRVITEPVMSTTLTFLIPFAAYALAETFHASGVLAVVVAGLMVGHVTPTMHSATARVSTWLNWTTIQYVLENTVFLLIGLHTHEVLAAASEYPVSNLTIVLASLAVLVSVIGLRIVYVMVVRPFLSPRLHPLVVAGRADHFVGRHARRRHPGRCPDAARRDPAAPRAAADRPGDGGRHPADSRAHPGVADPAVGRARPRPARGRPARGDGHPALDQRGRGRVEERRRTR
jgi:NhaP-type Na+/H+ or K+/H+ antiporter